MLMNFVDTRVGTNALLFLLGFLSPNTKGSFIPLDDGFLH